MSTGMILSKYKMVNKNIWDFSSICRLLSVQFWVFLSELKILLHFNSSRRAPFLFCNERLLTALDMVENCKKTEAERKLTVPRPVPTLDCQVMSNCKTIFQIYLSSYLCSRSIQSPSLQVNWLLPQEVRESTLLWFPTLHSIAADYKY